MCLARAIAHSIPSLQYFLVIFFNYSLHSILFCISFRYSIAVRQSYTLQSSPPDISSTHLARYIVIKILLTNFYAVHPHDYFVTTNLYLTPSPLLPSPPTPSSLAVNILFTVSMNLFQFCLFILFFRFHI